MFIFGSVCKVVLKKKNIWENMSWYLVAIRSSLRSIVCQSCLKPVGQNLDNVLILSTVANSKYSN